MDDTVMLIQRNSDFFHENARALALCNKMNESSKENVERKTLKQANIIFMFLLI